MLSKGFVSHCTYVPLIFCQKLGRSLGCLFSIPHEQDVTRQCHQMKELRAFLYTQAAMREMTRVRRGRAGLWRHDPFNLSQAVVCDCTESLLLQERPFWPKLMVSALSDVQAWYNTSLEPGCTAGGTGQPNHIFVGLMHQLCPVEGDKCFLHISWVNIL